MVSAPCSRAKRTHRASCQGGRDDDVALGRGPGPWLRVDDAVQEARSDARPRLLQDRVSGGGSPDFAMLQSRISALPVALGQC
jgi:hypothetical protein